jgi:hypothetical protein
MLKRLLLTLNRMPNKLLLMFKKAVQDASQAAKNAEQTAG